MQCLHPIFFFTSTVVTTLYCIDVSVLVSWIYNSSFLLCFCVHQRISWIGLYIDNIVLIFINSSRYRRLKCYLFSLMLLDEHIYKQLKVYQTQFKLAVRKSTKCCALISQDTLFYVIVYDKSALNWICK